VSIGEAINIARLKGPATSPGSSPGHGWTNGGLPPGYTRGGKGCEDRIYDETGFDCTPITREEWEEAKQNIVYRLERIREKQDESERETGRCWNCGQSLPSHRRPGEDAIVGLPDEY